MERHRPGLAITVNFDVEALGKGVHNRRADTMQAARSGIRSTSELTASVEFGENNFHSGKTGLRLDIHGNAAGAVAYFDTVVPVHHDADFVAVTAERLVDRVVDDLPQAMHQAT